MKNLLIKFLFFFTAPLLGAVTDDGFQISHRFLKNSSTSSADSASFNSILRSQIASGQFSSRIYKESDLGQIPLNDKLFLREFAKINFKWNQLAHVIYFDNKPMCLATAWIKSPQKPFMHVLWIKGWRVFKKYEYLFPHPNFIFDTEIEIGEDGWKTINLFIINKRALHGCFNKYFNLFKGIVGENCSFDWFISQLENGTHICDLIKNDEELMGILLGYGQESAKAFKNNNGKNVKDDYCIINISRPIGCHLFPVAFMGNPNSLEVEQLVSDYEGELDIFWNVYKQVDPLKLFIECICH